MLREILRAKIHRAVVTDKCLDYEGSIAVPGDVCEKAGVVEGEKVLVANVTNGERFETYVQVSEEGRFCLQGAAGRKGEVGDTIILMFFALAGEDEARGHTPIVVHMNEANEIVEVSR